MLVATHHPENNPEEEFPDPVASAVLDVKYCEVKGVYGISEDMSGRERAFVIGSEL